MSEISQKGVPTNDPKNIHDMTAFVQQTLTDMQNKFTNMSDQMMGRMDAMSSKLDDLEKSMLAMMDQAEED
ncbi:Oidioi.mRNA.OKI2018_I69.XSR.g14677.t1.cds [Oikopleura dioica]|uniref:Oidioi.mRNA.OKI2018_I69.XSR.g14677.t1.cds n=1 Tax=Oikopleura dioica TaxID=34765 RepID=A0ABN7SHU0_OIKDI|nr:Oidioi.mRNA.OKI2018_I69.XSR.g14677.t1.cds [Oikopleura dioica]